MEEKSQLPINFSPSDLVDILIKPISTSPESLVIIGEKIFLAIMNGAPLLKAIGQALALLLAVACLQRFWLTSNQI
jgi:hypothetical protein